MRLIETDDFQFEFLSEVGRRESWRKEIHRPIYHVHKWWAKRLGSVFRGVLLGCVLPERDDLSSQFYKSHRFGNLVVLDPFLGSGTTVGEAHKLGFTVLGRDINPVAVDAVRVALTLPTADRLNAGLAHLESLVGERLRALYVATDSTGSQAEVLYYFWVMLAKCVECRADVDLFSTYAFARNAYPGKKPEVQAVCPDCGDVFRSGRLTSELTCRNGHVFSASGPVHGSKATCRTCNAEFSVKQAVGGKRPSYRMYAKMVLRRDGVKEYLAATDADLALFDAAKQELQSSSLAVPALALADGHNTKQAMAYGFRNWSDFFNERQLLGLLTLRKAIADLPDDAVRDALQVLFSGTLEFNNVFASFKGEGTGAVRHMFSHHVLKPERMPIEANIWGTNRSSGSFSGLFKSRLLRASAYLDAPTEVSAESGAERVVASEPFSRELTPWKLPLPERSVALSCGDSSLSGLPDASVDLVVTDPPFFDNVHYSELADFFRAWSPSSSDAVRSTRHLEEVQDADGERFTAKLGNVFKEMARVLKDDGLMVFSYHHSREEGWLSVANALNEAGFAVVNAHPVRAELVNATPKAQAKEPIQLDMIIVCRKRGRAPQPLDQKEAEIRALAKLRRLEGAGFELSNGDRRVVMMGHRLMVRDAAAQF